MHYRVCRGRNIRRPACGRTGRSFKSLVDGAGGADRDCSTGSVEADWANPIGSKTRGAAVCADIDIEGGSRSHRSNRERSGKTADVVDGGACTLRIETCKAVLHIIAGHQLVGGGPGHHTVGGNAGHIGAEAAGQCGGGSLLGPTGLDAAAVLAHIEVVGGTAGKAGDGGGEGGTIVDGLARALGSGIEIRISAVFHLITVAVARHGPGHIDGVPGSGGGRDAGRFHAGRLGEGIYHTLTRCRVVGGEVGVGEFTGSSARSVAGDVRPIVGAVGTADTENVGSRRHQTDQDIDAATDGHRTIAEFNVASGVELQLEAVAVGAADDLAPFDHHLLGSGSSVD